MITDTELRLKGIKVLTDALGNVGMEKFISLLLREPFDYTKWQQDLWKDKSVNQLSKEAMTFHEKAK